MTRPEVAAGRFVANLKVLRESANLSQEKMGKILGVHQSAVSRIEKGEQGLTLSQIIRLTQLFGVSFEEMCA